MYISCASLMQEIFFLFQELLDVKDKSKSGFWIGILQLLPSLNNQFQIDLVFVAENYHFLDFFNPSNGKSRNAQPNYATFYPNGTMQASWMRKQVEQTSSQFIYLFHILIFLHITSIFNEILDHPKQNFQMTYTLVRNYFNNQRKMKQSCHLKIILV